jgi:hypothetical protein
MIIATFGASTAWLGKTITFDDGRFALEELGPIQPQAVVEYDRQGHLQWAYDGLREWVYQTAGEPLSAAPAAPVTPSATAPSFAPVTPPSAAPPSAPVAPAAGPSAPASGVVVQRSEPLAAPHVAPDTPPVVAPTPAQTSTPARGGSSRGLWLVLGGVVILALLIGLVVAGGRLRDGLGVAFTLLAVVFVIALVVALAKPGAFARRLPGTAPRTLQLACVGTVAVCLIFAAVLWWMPHYEVIAPADKRVALDEAPEIEVVVYNRGLLGGTYSAAYSVDGKQQDAVSFPLGGGQGREMTLSLPAGTERGPVLLALGGASVEAQAVAPPTFVVAPLQVDPSPAKLGDEVTLVTSVKNTGDLAGTFGGSLLVDGSELLKQPVEIKPGQTKDVAYDLTADRAGSYELALGDAASDFVIVKPVRLANGYAVKRSVNGGRAYMKVSNRTGSDAIAVLTRSSDKRKPVVAVYIRDGKTARIEGIPDGQYILWDCCGEDFNWTMRDFFTTVEHKRWLQPLKFNTTASTRRWTSYWSDASYNYSQGHSQTTTHWTNWTVTLGTGESKYTKTVSDGGFPQL